MAATGSDGKFALVPGEDAPTNNVSKSRVSRFVKGTNEPKPTNLDGQGALAMLKHPLCVLLICFPLGILAQFLNWGPIVLFWLNFASLIPLAKLLGDSTEELAAGLKNDVLAGLLNATFGNAVEMVITINTLRAGLQDMVKATLLGSVLSNLLLVLGMSFFCGGIVATAKPAQPQLTSETSSNKLGEKPDAGQAEVEEAFLGAVEKVQTYGKLNALVNTSMLLLSCLSFSLVTVFYTQASGEVASKEQLDQLLVPISRIISVIIIFAYVAYIYFQLYTHREAMAESGGEGGEGGEPEEEEPPNLSLTAALTCMLICTLVVSYSSDVMVKQLEPMVESAHIGSAFIGVILLPIVGNACEHASAIRFAMADKPGLSIGIAVGSSTQIALFVVPFSVIVGWIIDEPMDLNFGSLGTTVLSISVIVVLSVVLDGTANWLQGYLLMSAYTIVAVLYWFLPEKDG
mmetsp:Transcript_792/g.1487  ORF Transcript_792/g.1487 Transcript_792/m.1487 type:complete len:459 (-) Transcript_792:87-1463(-)